MSPVVGAGEPAFLPIFSRTGTHSIRYLITNSFEYLARRVLAIRRAEALSEDEHAGTPYVRDSHPHRRHRHASGSGSAGAGSRAGGEDKVIKLGEREKLSVGQRMKQACCA